MIIENKSYRTTQGKNGFSFVLYYPRDIRENTTAIFRINYGLFQWNYRLKISQLKGSDYLPVHIESSTFPDPTLTVIMGILITVLGVSALIWRRR